MNTFFRLKQFLVYQYRAKTKYYLHSPFVYQFYLDVLEGKQDANLKAINSLRSSLSRDQTIFPVKDYGTGGNRATSLSTIERNIAVRPQYGALLYRLSKRIKPRKILEIGTSIGLSSAYVALASRSADMVTLEGDATLAARARSIHADLGLYNVSVVTGEFSLTLPAALEQLGQIDLIFIDGNHRKEAVLQYFERCLQHVHHDSVMVVDDIYWSSEMAEAWQQIKRHQQVRLTLDVFQFGICFFMKEKLAKEDFVLRY